MMCHKAKYLLAAALLCGLDTRGHGFQNPKARNHALQRRHTPPMGEKSNDPINDNSFHRLMVDSSSRSHQQCSTTTTTRLKAANLVAAASSPIGAFFLLTGIVLVHEAGHYLAARSYGIKVDEFAIGFGPKLFGFEALGNEFNFRAFPLGGYVRFPENYNITLVQQQQKQLRKDYEQYEKDMQELGLSSKRTLGYELSNLLSLGTLDKQRRQEEEAALLQAQEEERKTPWWKAILGAAASKPTNKLPTPPKEMNPDDIPIDYYDDPDLLQNRPWFQRAVVLSGGVAFNLLLAFLIFFGEVTTSGLPQPVFDQGIVVTQNPARGAAANGILQRGDVVVGVNGNALAMSPSPSAAKAQEAITDFISIIRATPDGDSLSVSVIRNKGANPVDVLIQPKRVEASGPKTIGVMLSPNYLKTDVIRVDNPAKGIAPAAKLVSSMTQETAAGLTKFFAQIIAGKDTGGQQVSGPIGLIKTGSEVVSTNNWSTVLAFVAAVSINLGVVNAFPLPALDGGQLVFVVAELVTGRKVDQRVQEEIIGITVLLLIFVSASAAFGDVQNLLLKK